MQERLVPGRSLSAWASHHLFIEDFTTLLAVAGLLSSLKYPITDSHGFVALLTEEHHIGDMERRLFFEDPPPFLLTVGPGVSLDEIDLFDEHSFLLRKDLQDPAALSLLPSVGHHDQIILLKIIF